ARGGGATRGSLRGWGGLGWRSSSSPPPTPPASASRGAGTSGVQPGPLIASGGAAAGSKSPYRHSDRGPASIRSRETVTARRSQSYTGSSAPNQRPPTPPPPAPTPA